VLAPGEPDLRAEIPRGHPGVVGFAPEEIVNLNRWTARW
jgi:hypothetical protein